MIELIYFVLSIKKKYNTERVKLVKSFRSLWKKRLDHWFLIFLKSGNINFDYMKNTKLNDPKNKQKHPA